MMCWLLRMTVMRFWMRHRCSGVRSLVQAPRVKGSGGGSDSCLEVQLPIVEMSAF